MILFHSTNKNSPDVNIKEAILRGQAPDRGLFMLNEIPQLNQEEIYAFRNLDLPEIAYSVLSKITKEIIPESELKKIINSALTFDIPVEKITDYNYVMYLDRGPTCSFKDIGARMLARMMEYFLNLEDRNVIIITATSGDTGGAVASAFYEMNRSNVVVLYPKKEISNLQRKQMTTLGKNVTAIGINGKFDDCQRFAKLAFADKELEHLNLSSANSINVGRLLPQILYYFWGYSRIIESLGEEIIFSVPSGNFGNLMGGLIAYNMGLPVKRFVVAVNENDEFPRFLETGIYQKVIPSKHCISNAMNVGHPSNFARLVDLYGGHIDEQGIMHKDPELDKIRGDMFGISIDDDWTRKTIKDFYEKYTKVIEPHGAVGWAALQFYRNKFPENAKIKAICSETADPAKFPEEIISLININPKIPRSLDAISKKDEVPNPVEVNKYEDFKSFLLKNF